MGQARNVTDAKAIAMSDCSSEVAGNDASTSQLSAFCAGQSLSRYIVTKCMRTAQAESRQSGYGYKQTPLKVPRTKMLEMLDRNSADGQRAGDLAHHREQYRALGFGVATGESFASDLKLAVNCLIADYHSLDGPEIELCHDLSGGELRPVLQVPVLCIVRELLRTLVATARAGESWWESGETIRISTFRFRIGVSVSTAQRSLQSDEG